MSVYEVAPLQVDRVDVVVKYLGEGHARATHHFHQGTTDLQNLDFQNIRDRVRECLDGNRDEYYDLEVLLACPPGKYDPRDAFPMLIQQGFESLAMERLSECVNSRTHTLHLEAVIAYKPYWGGPMPAPAGLCVGGNQHLSAHGHEANQEAGAVHDYADESDVYGKIYEQLPHDHLRKQTKRELPSKKDHIGYQLLYAADAGCVGCIEYLLSHGVVDVNYKSLTTGWTALDCAHDKKHADAMQLLHSRGGKYNTMDPPQDEGD